MSKARVRGLTLVDGTPQRRSRFRGLALTASAAAHKARIRILRVIGTTRAPSVRIGRLNLTGRQPGARARVRGLSMYGGVLGALSANAGGGRHADPLTLVTLDGTASTGNPTGYSWAQVSNGAPTVTIIGSGAVVAFVAPAVAIGCDVVVELTVTLGPSTATDQATISVYPQLFWRRDEAGSSWLPEQIYDIT